MNILEAQTLLIFTMLSLTPDVINDPNGATLGKGWNKFWEIIFTCRVSSSKELQWYKVTDWIEYSLMLNNRTNLPSCLCTSLYFWEYIILFSLREGTYKNNALGHSRIHYNLYFSLYYFCSFLVHIVLELYYIYKLHK